MRFQEFVGDLDKDAGAVAGAHFGAAGAAMLQVHQYLDGLTHNGVALTALHIDEETHTASIMFVLRIVESLALRYSVHYLIATLFNRCSRALARLHRLTNLGTLRK